jgi:hypothetical protein
MSTIVPARCLVVLYTSPPVWLSKSGPDSTRTPADPAVVSPPDLRSADSSPDTV